jgi:hypothetical protein
MKKGNPKPPFIKTRTNQSHTNSAIGTLTNYGQQRLQIMHVPTGYEVVFPAFISQLSDAYNCNWSDERGYGRMDPVSTYLHTKRTMSVVWTVPAESLMGAKDNLDKMNKLVSFLYPYYTPGRGASSMNMGPLWKVKFGNLICNSATGGPLTGWAQGITVDPILEDGIFMLDAEASIDQTNGQASTEGDSKFSNNPNAGGVNYYPKTLRLNFEMVVLHEHDLGWVSGNPEAGLPYIFRGGQGEDIPFPYQVKDLDHPDVTNPMGSNISMQKTVGDYIDDHAFTGPSFRSAAEIPKTSAELEFEKEYNIPGGGLFGSAPKAGPRAFRGSAVENEAATAAASQALKPGKK